MAFNPRERPGRYAALATMIVIGMLGEACTRSKGRSPEATVTATSDLAPVTEAALPTSTATSFAEVMAAVTGTATPTATEVFTPTEVATATEEAPESEATQLVVTASNYLKQAQEFKVGTPGQRDHLYYALHDLADAMWLLGARSAAELAEMLPDLEVDPVEVLFGTEDKDGIVDLYDAIEDTMDTYRLLSAGAWEPETIELAFERLGLIDEGETIGSITLSVFQGGDLVEYYDQAGNRLSSAPTDLAGLPVWEVEIVGEDGEVLRTESLTMFCANFVVATATPGGTPVMTPERPPEQPTPKGTPTPTPTKEASPTPSETPGPSGTPRPSETPRPSDTPGATETPRPTATQHATATVQSPTDVPTMTPAPTAEGTPTQPPSPTPRQPTPETPQPTPPGPTETPWRPSGNQK